MTIRVAGADDIPAVLAVWAQARSAAWRGAMYRLAVLGEVWRLVHAMRDSSATPRPRTLPRCGSTFVGH